MGEPSKAEASLFLKPTQPAVENAKATPEPEAEAEPKDEVGPSASKSDTADKALTTSRSPDESRMEWPGVLNPKAPLDNARKFVALRHWCRDENVRSVQFWQGQFWGWSGAQWRVVDDATLSGLMK